MKGLLTFTAIVGALLMAAGCYGSTPPVVKIGLLAPFEERYRDDGYSALQAVRSALHERNAAGGVAGYQVALVALNDNGRPEEAPAGRPADWAAAAASAANRLLDAMERAGQQGAGLTRPAVLHALSEMGDTP